MRTRSEHLEWCKTRALEYCQIGDLQQAFASMASDLRKHPETENGAAAIAIGLGMSMLIGGHLGTRAKMEEFIRGFN